MHFDRTCLSSSPNTIDDKIISINQLRRHIWWITNEWHSIFVIHAPLGKLSSFHCPVQCCLWIWSRKCRFEFKSDQNRALPETNSAEVDQILSEVYESKFVQKSGIRPDNTSGTWPNLPRNQYYVFFVLYPKNIVEMKVCFLRVELCNLF